MTQITDVSVSHELVFNDFNLNAIKWPTINAIINYIVILFSF